MSSTFGESKFDGEGTETKLWRFADERANKIGPHHTVFWCKRDPKWVEAKRLGLPTKQVGFGKVNRRHTRGWLETTRPPSRRGLFVRYGWRVVR